MRLPWCLLLLAACGGNADDGFSKDPTAIDALVVTDGKPVANRGIMLISSDGKVQTLATGAKGHAIAFLGPDATEATIYSDATDGRTMIQGVIPGDHLCIGCTYTTTACDGLPQITGLHRVNDGWVWTITGDGAYVGMEISWTGGRLLSPPGNTSASTQNAADITIVLFARKDLASYDDLRTLGVTGWSKQPFCATSVHAT